MATRYERTARAIIIYGSFVMLCRWAKGDWWSLPGGHCKAGEATADTVRREMREETGREVSRLAYLTTILNDFDKDGVHIQEEVALFKADLYPRLVEDPAQSNEAHLVFAWAPVVETPLWPILPPTVIDWILFAGGS